MRDFDDLDDEDESDELPRTSRRGRTYVHPRCGGATHVSGRDYQRISDPFALVPSTYCCGCKGYVSLSDIRWADTKENVGAYRRRMRALTPGLIKAWRFGLGLFPGLPIGALIALIYFLATGMRGVTADYVALITISGALIAGVVGYFIGGMVLHSVYEIDYRLIR